MRAPPASTSAASVWEGRRRWGERRDKLRETLFTSQYVMCTHTMLTTSYHHFQHPCHTQVRFVCRSVEFNYVTLQCHLSEYDRRSPGAFPVELVETQGVDYFENSCLQCKYFVAPCSLASSPDYLPQR